MTVIKDWRPGHYRVVCERSGRVCWDDEVRKEWDGTIVYEKYYEARNPQDFVRSRPDQKPVPIPRPEPADEFVQFPHIIQDHEGEFVLDSLGLTVQED